MMAQIPDIAFEIDGDLVRIEQSAGCGEVASVDLHRLHVAHLAGLLGLIPPASHPVAPKALTGGPESMDSLEVSTDDDGTIWLSQTRVRGMGGSDESIALHPSQAAWLAEQLGASASALASPNGPQARALRRLWTKLDLLTSDCWMSEVIEHCGSGLAYQAHADEARTILTGLLEDIGLVAPSDNEPSGEERNEFLLRDRNENSDISVTPASEPKRGRPASGQALTNAERQARHRAKQADLLTENA